MGYLITNSVVGQKIEYREASHAGSRLALGALAQTTRYWTQTEMNTRLVDLTGNLLFNRVCVVLGLVFLGFTLWRFSMTERAPSKRRLRRLARRDRRRPVSLLSPKGTAAEQRA